MIIALSKTSNFFAKKIYFLCRLYQNEGQIKLKKLRKINQETLTIKKKKKIGIEI